MRGSYFCAGFVRPGATCRLASVCGIFAPPFAAIICWRMADDSPPRRPDGGPANEESEGAPGNREPGTGNTCGPPKVANAPFEFQFQSFASHRPSVEGDNATRLYTPPLASCYAHPYVYVTRCYQNARCL